MIQLIALALADSMQQHVKKELESAQIYFTMSAWCADKGYEHTSK
jgi:ferritin